jgi:hypothetical protein
LAEKQPWLDISLMIKHEIIRSTRKKQRQEKSFL